MSKPKLFISYKSGHKISNEIIQEIEKEIDHDFDILIDKEIKLGTRWTQELYQWLLNCDAAIVIVSKEANESDWCRREWAVLVARWNIKGIPVIPVCVENRFFDTGILDEIQGTKGIICTSNYLKKIKTALSKANSQELTANDYLAAHQAWLYWQYNDAPVFQKEPYALADVYIEPECGILQWDQVQNDRLDPFQDSKKCGGRCSLLETVLSYMKDPEFSDLITIQAGPGAGKSAFAYRLASQLMDEGLQPIVINFKDLRLSNFSSVGELLDDAIRIDYSDEKSPNPELEIINTLIDKSINFGNAEICKTTIILDAWDEVSLTGNVSFKDQLLTWLPKIREYFIRRRGIKIRLILTGRPSKEVTDSGILRNNTPILTVRPMRPNQLKKYAQNISKHLSDPKKVHKSEIDNVNWSIDQKALAPVFEHYKNWYNDEKNDTESTGDFLGNPLLAYLSFIVFAETDKLPDDLISKPTALYHELINITVKHAGKAKDGDLDNAVHRGGSHLRPLLQEVAATISMLRQESVSFTELQLRFDDTELPIPKNLLNNWYKKDNTDTALQELVINFYFKGGNTNLGCEFLHKSFREYLFAEAIFSSLKDAAEGQDGLFESRKEYKYWEDFEPNTPEFKLSRRLAYLLSAQWMSTEVRDHLFWLIKNDIDSNLKQWIWLRDAVLSVYAWWAEGVLIRHQPRARGRWHEPFVSELFQQVIPFDCKEDFPPIRTSVLDSHLGHALMQITAYIFDKLFEISKPENKQKKREQGYCSISDRTIRFQPGGQGFLKALVSKFSTEGWGQYDMSNMYLRRIKVLENGFSKNIIADNCDLIKSDLSRVNLRGADLNKANLKGADLHRSNLIGSNLNQANLNCAKLIGANFLGANLISSNLNHANLLEANLIGVNFNGAKLNHANFHKANLLGADLIEARLIEATLSWVDLVDANLTDADLSKANLSGANLFGANFNRANLNGTLLTNVIGYNPDK